MFGGPTAHCSSIGHRRTAFIHCFTHLRTPPALCGRAFAPMARSMVDRKFVHAAGLWKGKKSNKRKQSKEEKKPPSRGRKRKTGGQLAVDNWQLAMGGGARSDDARWGAPTANRPLNGSAVLRQGTPRGTLPALCGRALAKIGGTLAGTLVRPAAQLWKGKKSNKRK